jgi:broad specificity phosphatase PhoE
VDDPVGEPDLSGPADPLIPEGLDAVLVFVRHGESTYIAEDRFQGQADPPLTGLGRRQAGLTGIRLADPHASPPMPVPVGPPRELVHSPLGRAAETAAAIRAGWAAAGTPVATRADTGFTELGQGAWEGLHRAEITERWGTELAAWRRAPLENWAPGGESLPDVAARVRPALTRVLTGLAEGQTPDTQERSPVAGYAEPVSRHPWSIVVGHDGVFKVVLLTLFDVGLDRFWMWSMDLCGITVVELRGGRPVLRAHDLTAHLAALSELGAPGVAGEDQDPDARARSGAL